MPVASVSHMLAEVCVVMKRQHSVHIASTTWCMILHFCVKYDKGKEKGRKKNGKKNMQHDECLDQ